MVTTRNMRKQKISKINEKIRKRNENLSREHEDRVYQKFDCLRTQLFKSMEELYNLKNFDLHQTKIVIEGFENNLQRWQIIERMRHISDGNCQVCQTNCKEDDKEKNLRHENDLIAYQTKNQSKIIAVKNELDRFILEETQKLDGLFKMLLPQN